MASEISSSAASQQQQQQQQPLQKQQRILKADVKFCGKFLLSNEEDFSVEKAKQLVHRATVEQRVHLHTTAKLTEAGIRIGRDGVLSSMPEEFVRYPRVLGLVSLMDDTKTLALCLQTYGGQRCVTVLQFKDPRALSVVVDVIDRHRRQLLAEGDVETFGDNSKNWVLRQSSQQPPQDPEDAIDTSVVFNDDYAELRKEIFVTDSVSSSAQQQQQQQSLQQQRQELHEEFQRQQQRQQQREQQQQQQQREQQQREQTLVVAQVNGGPHERREIETVILDYDDLDGDVQKQQQQQQQQQQRESIVQVRSQYQSQYRQQQQQRYSSGASSSPTSPTGRHVVTSFSSGSSGVAGPTTSTIELRSKSMEPRYRTSTVIYRDSTDAAQRVTYLPSQQQQPQQLLLQQQPQQQQQHLVRLVPVGSARKHHRPQTKYYTLQPLSPRESGVYTATK